MLEIFRTLPDLAGVSVGTRPDCLDPEKNGYPRRRAVERKMA